MKTKDTKKTDWKELSSKVCKIANKIPHKVSRSRAFFKAWKIVKKNCVEEKEVKVQKIKFTDYVNMVRSRAHYYARCYRMDYEDIEAQGFLIYCMAIRDYNKKRASFSTFLYRNLSGRLRDYCKQKTEAESLDNFDEAFESFTDLFEARKDCPQEQFLQYAHDYLTPFAFKILKWLVQDQLSCLRSKTKPSLISMAKILSVSLDTLNSAWQELSDFWNLKGAAFYASN
jgi:hypothetical protein